MLSFYKLLILFNLALKEISFMYVYDYRVQRVANAVDVTETFETFLWLEKDIGKKKNLSTFDRFLLVSKLDYMLTQRMRITTPVFLLKEK